MPSQSYENQDNAATLAIQLTESLCTVFSLVLSRIGADNVQATANENEPTKIIFINNVTGMDSEDFCAVSVEVVDFVTDADGATWANVSLTQTNRRSMGNPKKEFLLHTADVGVGDKRYGESEIAYRNRRAAALLDIYKPVAELTRSMMQEYFVGAVKLILGP